MDVMPISQFKARCLSVMDRVRRTGRSVRVTRYGKPVADVVPAGAVVRATRTLGLLRDATTISGGPGDLVAPVAASRDWDVLK